MIGRHEHRVYAVMDTNVLVSAMLKPDSVPGRVVAHAFEGRVVPIVSAEIEREYDNVLHRKKFRFEHSVVRKFLSALEDISVHRVPAPLDSQSVVLPNQKDVVFYAVTLSAREEWDARLVTGNAKHFPADAFVVSPREMLDVLEGLDGS